MATKENRITDWIFTVSYGRICYGKIAFFGGYLMFGKLISMSEPWLQYAIRLNLLNENRGDLLDLKKEVKKTKKSYRILTILQTSIMQ